MQKHGCAGEEKSTRSKDFNVGLKGGLFDTQHYERMGPALWLYGWLVLRQTRQEGTLGYVLGGKPITYTEIEGETGFGRKTLERWMRVLRTEGYIETKTASTGIIVTITKAKKFAKQDQRGQVAGGSPHSGSSDFRTPELWARDLKSAPKVPRFAEPSIDKPEQFQLFCSGISSGSVEETIENPCSPKTYTEPGKSSGIRSPQQQREKPEREEARFTTGPGPGSNRDWRWLRDELVRRELRVGAGPEVRPARKT
jgi:hypothetical protein